MYTSPTSDPTSVVKPMALYFTDPPSSSSSLFTRGQLSKQGNRTEKTENKDNCYHILHQKGRSGGEVDH